MPGLQLADMRPVSSDVSYPLSPITMRNTSTMRETATMGGFAGTAGLLSESSHKNSVKMPFRSLMTRPRQPRNHSLMHWKSCELWERLNTRTQLEFISCLALVTVILSIYPSLRGVHKCNDNTATRLNGSAHGDLVMNPHNESSMHEDFDLWELESSPRLFGAHVVCSYMMIVALFAYAFLLRSTSRTEVSVLEQLVGWCIFLGWSCTTCFAMERALFWCESNEHILLLGKIFQALGTAFYIRFIWLYMLALQKRVQLVEVSFGSRLGSWIIRRFRHLSFAIGLLHLLVLIYLAFLYLSFLRGSKQSYVVSKLSLRTNAAHHVTLATAFGVIATISARALGKVRLAIDLSEMPNVVSAFAVAEAKWAYKVLGRMRWTTSLPCVVQAAMVAEQAIVHILEMELAHPIRWINLRGFSPFAQAIGIIFDVVCVFVFFASLSKAALWQQFDEQRARKSADRIRNSSNVVIHRERCFAEDWRPAHSSSSAAWSEKVRDLAERSISVYKLLEFFSSLGPEGSMMFHFDPWLSTTNDVVRQAIIPASRKGQGGTSYSRIEGVDDRPRKVSSFATLPARMVTHCWSNLFIHLVAAVVADALDLDEYEEIAQALADGRQGVEDITFELFCKGTCYRRYWICAFCVNQHAGICGGFGPQPPEGSRDYEEWDAKRRDTASGEIHPCCPCKQPKYFNDSPDECEMNKFDDMMAYLRDEVYDLRQVVAVDRDFDLFVRAWCISELVQAHVSGIPQDVRLLSSKVLGIEDGDLAIYRKLATLTVANCEASRPEDKADILARIPDITMFDAKLQTIIFGDRGLLQQRLEGFGIWEAAVRVACRFQCLRKSGAPTAPP